MLLYWLWLANRPNVSDGVKCALMRQFSDPQDVYFASEEELRQVPGMTRQALEALKSPAEYPCAYHEGPPVSPAAPGNLRRATASLL